MCLIQGQLGLISFYSREKVTVQIQNNHDAFRHAFKSMKIYRWQRNRTINKKYVIDFSLIDARKRCKVLNSRAWYALDIVNDVIMTSSFELKFYECKSELLYDKNDRLVKKRKLDKSKIDSSFFNLRIQTESNDIEYQLIEFIGIPFISLFHLSRLSL